MNFLMTSDVDIQGSGYGGIITNLALRLYQKEHGVSVLGLDYKHQLHYFPFPIVPTDLQIIRSQIETIKQTLWPDILLMAWDIPTQNRPVEWFANKGVAKYVGLFPVEAAPLAEIKQWVDSIRKMDVAFTISQFGLEECRKAGLDNVHFLPVGVDLNIWNPMEENEREILKFDLELDNRFVVLTVADNHFRKNLAGGIQAIAKVVKELPEVLYVIVARPHSVQLGWSLKELAERYGIQDNVRVIHSRPNHEMLKRLYQAADVYFCTSTAEGLGLPLLEAMACGTPVIGTDCTAIHELLDEGKGVLVDPEYLYVDPFGNTNRAFIDTTKAAQAILSLTDIKKKQEIVCKAISFVSERNYDVATDILLEVLSD